MEKAVAQPFTGSTRSVRTARGDDESEHSGCGLLASHDGNGNAKFVEIDAREGTGQSALDYGESRQHRPQHGPNCCDYAFGFAGFDQSNNRSAIAGRFTANGVGTLRTEPPT